MGTTDRHGTKHDAILDGARRVFLESGYGAASMDTVAAEAGVSKQTAYAHFGSKEALFTEVVASMTGAVSDAVQQPLTDDASLTRATLTDWLIDHGVRQLRSVLAPDVVRLRRLVIAEFDRFPDLARALFDAGAGRAIANLAAVLARADEQGVLALSDPTRAAAQLNWLIMGEPLNRAMLLGGERTPTLATLQKHARLSVETFVRAYVPTG